MESITKQITYVGLEKLKKKVDATILSDGLKQISWGPIQDNDDNSIFLTYFFKYVYLKAMEEQS